MLPRRKTLRLKSYDYTSSGAYFLTFCTLGRLPLLGRIIDGRVQHNPIGHMVDSVWQGLPNRYPGIILDAHIVMPDHFHGIVFLDHRSNIPTAGDDPSPEKKSAFGLSDLIQRFKSFTTHRFQTEFQTNPIQRLWHRNYYEHIIRNERALAIIRRYILENPARCSKDIGDFPANGPINGFPEQPGTRGGVPLQY